MNSRSFKKYYRGYFKSLFRAVGFYCVLPGQHLLPTGGQKRAIRMKQEHSTSLTPNFSKVNNPSHEMADDQYDIIGVSGLVQPNRSCVFTTAPSIVQTACFTVFPLLWLGPIDQAMQHFDVDPSTACGSPVLLEIPERYLPSLTIFIHISHYPLDFAARIRNQARPCFDNFLYSLILEA